MDIWRWLHYSGFQPSRQIIIIIFIILIISITSNDTINRAGNKFQRTAMQKTLANCSTKILAATGL
jgi:hypothetical protein